jgi:putative chitinase
MNLSAEEIAKATGSTLELAEKYRQYLNKYMSKYDINTPERAIAFLAQVGTESGGLKFTKEQGSDSYFQKYEFRQDLGNTQAGDGLRFKGRGLIQLTGRANYKKMSEKVDKDLISNPQLVEQPDLAVEVSTIFWHDRIRNGLNLNQWADKLNLQQPVDSSANWDVHTNITKAINGGTNAINDRADRMKGGSEVYAMIKKKISSTGSKKTKRIVFFSLIGITIIGLSIYAYKKIGK